MNSTLLRTGEVKFNASINEARGTNEGRKKFNYSGWSSFISQTFSHLFVYVFVYN